jgi:hypothetical protein
MAARLGARIVPLRVISKGRRPIRSLAGEGAGEVPMATSGANQVAARARRPAVSADVPILAAKITVPSVPDWALPRPRITKLIAQGTRWYPLTVLTAPAGAGKTMALTLWTAAQPGLVAWVCLDEYDNRPGVFWAYVVTALRQSGVAVPGALPAARGPDADHVFLLWLASVLAGQDPPVTLVLDDLHLLTDPAVLDGLAYVLRNAGPGLRLVVSARADPLPLHCYRLAGELAEIRASDLAFTIERLPADQETTGRLAAAVIRLAVSRRTGDLTAATAAAARAEALASRVPGDKLAGHPDIRARVLSGRGVVELWSGHLDEAARVLESGVAAETASGRRGEPADCLGHLALAEALLGRLCRAATVAAQAATALSADQQRPPVPDPNPAALVALAWVHLGHYELREAHSRLEQVDAALSVTPDKLIGAVAWLAAAYGSLAEGRTAVAAQNVARARSGWSVPPGIGSRRRLPATLVTRCRHRLLPAVKALRAAAAASRRGRA